MAPPGRVLIGHPDPLARAYLRGIAESHLGLVDTVESDSFDVLLAQLRDEPRIVLAIIDLELPGMSWEGGLRYLEIEHQGLAVAVLSGSLGQDRLDMLSISANTALMPKRLPESSLVEMLQRLLGAVDKAACPPAALPMNNHAAQSYLTSRQYDVLRLVSQGRSNREISRALGIAEGTVKVHVNAAFRVLGVHNRVSATTAFRHYSEARQVIP
jgi:DNA-binding NarL/FixJ family response regulator